MVKLPSGKKKYKDIIKHYKKEYQEKIKAEKKQHDALVEYKRKIKKRQEKEAKANKKARDKLVGRLKDRLKNFSASGLKTKQFAIDISKGGLILPKRRVDILYGHRRYK